MFIYHRKCLSVNLNIFFLKKPRPSANPISQQPVLDILQRLKSSVDKIAHGDGKLRVSEY